MKPGRRLLDETRVRVYLRREHGMVGTELDHMAEWADVGRLGAAGWTEQAVAAIRHAAEHAPDARIAATWERLAEQGDALLRDLRG